MPRAKRTYTPGCVWHLTHRCHNREFLLRFEKDRSRWRYWLFKARKRYGLSILNYIVTSNHVHLLVRDTRKGAIARAMQLVSGRVAQEYNKRTDRRGAFWEDRYFATAVSSDHHLIRCLVYIDLNMVRAGVVRHPEQWKHCGFNEIQRPRLRYRVIDHQALCRLTNSKNREAFNLKHRAWVASELRRGALQRDPKWTESAAVGPESFTLDFKSKK